MCKTPQKNRERKSFLPHYDGQIFLHFSLFFAKREKFSAENRNKSKYFEKMWKRRKTLIKSGFFRAEMWKTMLKMWIKPSFFVRKECGKLRKRSRFAGKSAFNA